MLYVPLIRNVLRVLAGSTLHSWAVAKDDIDAIFSDPAVDLLIGGFLLVIAEGWYLLAKRFGWST